jgi:eukaryotic-like serine/threonine-protein kinase
MSSADPHQVPTGTILEGKFRLTQEIGRGGMAAVYEAENVDIGKRVAVKILSSELITSRVVRERFMREARAAAAIHSPYICEVFDSGMFQERPFLVMELLLGESLYDHMSRVRQLKVGTVLRIMKHVTRGLDKAHQAGVVHRDLKPENIFLTQDEDGKLLAKIVDFGLAKFYESRDGAPDRNVRLTREGALFGTPAYMSPEQARGQGEVDHRADLWALGCITYECLTGTTVWDVQQGVAMILAQIARGQLPDPRERRPDLGPSFVAWFERALHPDLTQRFATASEFYQSLELALADGSLASQNVSSVELLGPQSQGALSPLIAAAEPLPVAPESKARNPWRGVVALVGSAALVLGGYTLWLFAPNDIRDGARGIFSASESPGVDENGARPAETGPGADAIAEAQELLRKDQPKEALQLLAGARGESPHVALSLIAHAEVAVEPKGLCQLTGLGRPRPFGIVAPASRPQLALGAQGLLVAWSDTHENSARRNIHATLLDDALRRVGETRNISPEAHSAVSPLFGRAKGGLGLFYWDSGTAPGVYVRHISDDGRILSPPRRLSEQRKEKYFPGIVEGLNGEVWVLWSETGPTGNREIALLELDGELKPTRPPRLVTSHERGDASEPRGQVVGGELVLVYQVRFKNSDSEIHLRRLSLESLRAQPSPVEAGKQGAASGTSVLVRSSPRQAEPDLSCSAEGCLVVWDDEASGGFAAYIPKAARAPLWHNEFSAKAKRPTISHRASGEIAIAYYAGDRLMLQLATDTGLLEASVISKVSGFHPSPHLIAGPSPGEWFIAWRDYEAGHLEIFVARASCKASGGT